MVGDYLLDEVRDALGADLHVEPGDATALVRLVERLGEHVEPTDIQPISRDADDDPVLALARESDAVFLATYDHDLMAVRSIGMCGIVHPSTALQLVSSAAAEDLAEGIPGVSTEDRSRWRYEDFGPPLMAALVFVDWVRQLPENPEKGLHTDNARELAGLAAVSGDGSSVRVDSFRLGMVDEGQISS